MPTKWSRTMQIQDLAAKLLGMMGFPRIGNSFHYKAEVGSALQIAVHRNGLAERSDTSPAGSPR